MWYEKKSFLLLHPGVAVACKNAKTHETLSAMALQGASSLLQSVRCETRINTHSKTWFLLSNSNYEYQYFLGEKCLKANCFEAKSA